MTGLEHLDAERVNAAPGKLVEGHAPHGAETDDDGVERAIHGALPLPVVYPAGRCINRIIGLRGLLAASRASCTATASARRSKALAVSESG